MSVEIKNDCINPPRGLLWHVQLSLSWIYPADLDGLEFIRLVDKVPEHVLKKNKTFREREAEGDWIFGFYQKEQGNNWPSITLIVKRPYALLPSLYKFTPVATMLLAHTLAHEVGHHLISTRGYVFEQREQYRREEFEEEFCNRYAFEVLKKMQSRWYYRLGMWGLKDLAGWFHIFGMIDWEKKRYDAAAAYWKKVIQLNPDSEESVYWYYRAKKLTQEESQLSKEEQM